VKRFKLSYYTIISKPVNGSGHRLVLSTRTGKMVLLSETCIAFLQNNLIEHLPLATKEKLIGCSILVEEDENELQTIINENHDYIEDEKELYEVIQVSANCQLGCYYCGQQHAKVNISDDLVEKLTGRIALKFSSGNYERVYIGWFGSEPLMGLNQMRIIYSKLVQKIGGGIPVGGKVVTNGLSLKEDVFEELVSTLNVNRIEVTLDGVGQVHDQHRFLKSGGGSFDVIYRNLTKILNRPGFGALGCKVTIRCNVDYNNVDGVEPLIRKLAEDGLHTKIAALYFVGVYSWGGNEAHKNSLTKEKFANLRLKWEILKIQLGYPQQQDGKYGRTKKLCIAVGGTSEVYDAYGGVYNCTEIPYASYYDDKPFKLGNLKENSEVFFDKKPFNDWYTVVRDTQRYPCHSCKLLPICGGGCPKSWAEDNMACPPLKYSVQKDMHFRYLLKTTPKEQLPSALKIFDESLKEEDFFRYQ
jgi:uncharacterized protein